MENKSKKVFCFFLNIWEYRIVAIAADCKSVPSGSVVQVHLLSQKYKQLKYRKERHYINLNMRNPPCLASKGMAIQVGVSTEEGI